MNTGRYSLPGLNVLAANISEWRKGKGFSGIYHLDDTRNKDLMLSKLMLVVTEVGEAAEAVRKGDIENFKEELADTIIRVLDITHSMGVDISEEIANKMEVNEKRPFLHGKLTSS